MQQMRESQATDEYSNSVRAHISRSAWHENERSHQLCCLSLTGRLAQRCSHKPIAIVYEGLWKHGACRVLDSLVPISSVTRHERVEIPMVNHPIQKSGDCRTS